MRFSDTLSRPSGRLYYYAGGVLICVSASHHTAGFAVLERLTATVPSSAELILQAGVHGAVVLATCNRFELYLDLETEGAADHILDRLARSAGVTVQDLHDGTHRFSQSRVAAHLFAVVSGLESVVIGEAEITGQVRRAVNQARTDAAMTPRLERLFQMASSTSRRVRHRSGINEAGRSMVRLALDLAESRILDWRRARVVLIGTGAYAGATLTALRARGVPAVQVLSPSQQPERMADKDGADPQPWDQLPRLLAAADVVITSTNTCAVDVALLEAARRNCAGELLIVDLGMPANVDARVGTLHGVELLDLATIARHAPVAELDASARAQDAVAHATSEFTAAVARTEATPTIVALRRHVDDLIATELDRLHRRGQHTPEAEQAVKHFAAMLLHTPLTRAREGAVVDGPEPFARSVAQVFGIDTADPVEPSRRWCA